MKTIKMKTFATSIAACVLLFASCKKEEGPEGPAGAAGANGVVPTMTDGFIKGNVSGTREDGTAFNETFNYTSYWSGPSGTLDSNSVASYDFNIARGVTLLGDNGADITVNTTSKTASTGTITLNGFVFSKSLGTNKKFEFTLNSSAATTITGLSYNATSGLFTGNFSYTVTGVQNSTGNTATISGSFRATMTQMYYLTQHSGSVSK